MAIWLRVINAGLYLAACLLVATGLALEWKIEAENEGQFLLGLNGDAWGEIHFATALAVVALTLAHLALNWSWIKGLLARLRAPVLTTLVVGVGIIALVLLAPVTGTGGPDGQRQEQRQHDD